MQIRTVNELRELLKTIWVSLDDLVWINIYSVTRHFGGPEEGGWWYDWSECVTSVPVKIRGEITLTAGKIHNLIEVLRETGLYEDEGDIYSANGGVLFDVRLEENKEETETTGRPRYE